MEKERRHQIHAKISKLEDELNSNVASFGPRTVLAEAIPVEGTPFVRISTPPGSARSEHSEPHSSYPILPESAEDAKNWGCSTSFQVDSNGRVNAAIPPKDVENIKNGTDVSLPSGRSAVMLDIGSVGNLAGEEWLKALALKAVKSGRKPNSYKRDRTLHVSGVGTGSQECKFNCEIPAAIPTTAGFLKGTYKSPCVPNSSLPALLGLESL
jgi:hypothetical protein